MTRTSIARHRVVVIGNGMVGHRFCEILHEADRNRKFEIIVIGEEPRTAYDRVHLSEFFSGKTAKDLELAAPSWYADRDIALHLGERVIAIHRDIQQIETDRGRLIRYDSAVVATGSS